MAPWLTIPETTPLVISVDYVPVDGSPPPTAHSLAPPGGDIILSLLPGLSPAAVTSVENLLGTGLPQIFQQLWVSQQSNIQNQISNAVTTASSGSYGVVANIPQTGGTLKASVDPLGSETSGLLPPTASGAAQPGSQLSLSFGVSGIQVNFSAPSDVILVLAGFLGIFGSSVATPTWKFSFDGQLNIYLAVPSDATVPMGFNVEFVANNISALTPTNLAAGLVWPVFKIGQLLNIVSSFPSSETTSISNAGVTQYFSEMAQGFVAASAFGFTQLAVQINQSEQNAVQFDLMHPFDAGPVPTDYYVPWLIGPSISLNKSVAHPGDPVTVTGIYWVAGGASGPPSTLTITWVDTTSGSVTQTEVNYGQVSSSSVQSPPSITDVKIDRTTVENSAPLYVAQGLVPSSTYLFRLRDYDADNFIATAWSKWVPFQTSAAAVTSAQIALSDNPSNALQTTTILPGGAFVATFTVPASQTPGTYNVLATAAPNLAGQQPLTIIPSSQSLPALLELYDPTTGQPFAAPTSLYYTPGNPFYLAGLNWAPGEVDVYVNNVSGPLLGKPVADSTGTFKLPTTISQNAATQIWAQQGGTGVGLPIQVLTPPK